MPKCFCIHRSKPFQPMCKHGRVSSMQCFLKQSHLSQSLPPAIAPCHQYLQPSSHNHKQSQMKETQTVQTSSNNIQPQAHFFPCTSLVILPILVSWRLRRLWEFFPTERLRHRGRGWRLWQAYWPFHSGRCPLRFVVHWHQFLLNHLSASSIQFTSNKGSTN